MLITEPVDIHPVTIISAPRTGTKIQKQRLLAAGKKVANSTSLLRDRVPGSDSKKVDIPARYREEAVTKEK